MENSGGKGGDRIVMSIFRDVHDGKGGICLRDIDTKNVVD
jgi:hypothetical protein